MKSSTKRSFDQSLEQIMQHQYTIRVLERELKAFEGRLAVALERSQPVIESSVRKLVAYSWTFLKLCRTNGHAHFVPSCLAAVDYFVNPDDAIEDFATYDGFEDDLEVFEAVAAKYELEGHLSKLSA